MFRKKKDEDVGGGSWSDDDTDGVFRGQFDEEPFESFFADFGRFEEIINELMRNAFNGSFRAGKPFVYGFSVKTGPDGRPIVNEFGNVKPHGQPVISEAREPLIDVMEGENEIIVIAELPGVKKEDIGLEATSDTLNIKVDTPDRKYYKEIRLPAEIDESSTEASYHNGVLEVKLKRKYAKSPKGKRVDIK